MTKCKVLSLGRFRGINTGTSAVIPPMAMLDTACEQVWESQGEERVLPSIAIPKRVSEIDV